MKKKTTKEKELSGTNRPDRTKSAKKTDIEIPKPESYLNDEQIEIYNRICEHISEHSLLQTIDSLYVSQVAVAYYNVSKYTKITNKEGLVQKYESGATNTSGYYNALKGERDFLKDANRQLGLTVKAREDLNSFSERVTPLKATTEEVKKDRFGGRLTKVS